MDSIYTRLGGAPAVARLVFDFYDRVLASERLAPYFLGIDMARLVDHQAKFIGSAMGAPIAFDSDELAEAHAHLGIDAAAFDEMIGLLEATLRSAGLTAAETARVIEEARAHRPLVVASALEAG